MQNERHIYRKYFGYGFSQDPIKNAVVRAFCSVIRRDEHREVWFKTINDETVRNVLDEDDYALWVSEKNEGLVATA